MKGIKLNIIINVLYSNMNEYTATLKVSREMENNLQCIPQTQSLALRHISHERTSITTFRIVHHIKNALILSISMIFLLYLFALNIDFIHHSWEGDALADVLLGGQPGDCSFDAETEAAVRHGAVFSQVQVPVIILDIQALLIDSGQESSSSLRTIWRLSV
jgi:hypothetical protein